MAIVNGIGRIGYMKGGGKALWKDENIADSITSHAIGFIREHKDEPFFMYFATNDVHVPRFPHDRFRGKNPMGLRGDAIVQFDWSVGQIMETLDKLGLSENTLIILSSDNGPVVDDGYQDRAEELLNGHSPAGPLRGNKYSAFEGGTRIPAIVRWPKGAASSQVSNALVSQIDWFASLASLVGPSPSLKVALPPPPVTAKFPENAHLSFLYTANTLGMNGAEASPLYTLVAFPPNPANGAKVEVIVLVWNALCPLSDK